MNRWSATLAVVALGAILGLGPTPAGAQPWKDAYLKGVEHLDSGRWAEAAAAFEAAARDNPRESGSVRLYGMRYGYFPYRDRGIALYRMGEWDAAIQALEESVRQGVAPDASRSLELARQRVPFVDVRRVFRGTWWDYYERGLLRAEGGQWKQAIEDLRAARRGREGEQRSARTYGLQFIEYFPLRELGAALYHDGQHKAAVEVLQRSLASVPTAKAGYFLDLARGALLRQSAGDRQPPRIRLDPPLDGLVTNVTSLDVRGTAESKNLVVTVSVNGQPDLVEIAAASLAFAVSTPLVPGMNPIEIVARDLAGLESRTTVNVVVDREGPVVVLDRMARTASGGLRVEGSVFDNVRLGTLAINGLPVGLTGTNESHFALDVAATADAVQVEAGDTAGNVTRIRLPVPATLRQPGGRRALPIVPVAWQPAVVPVIFHSNEPLAIHVEPLPSEVQQERISISWMVTANAALAAVKINDEAKSLPQVPPGKPQLFSHILTLAEGPNAITITASDRAGRTVSAPVKIVRKAEQVEAIGARLSVAVMPFLHKGKASDLYEGAYDAMVDALVNQGRFKIVSRSELERIVKELNLSRTELVNPATAVKVGKLVAAEAIMVGTVNETATTAEVYVQVISTETSTVLAAKDVFDPAKAPGSAREKMRELAARVRHEYPVVVGSVVTISNRRVAVALGSQKRVRADMRVIVFQEGEPLIDPQTKVVLDRNVESLGEGVLAEVRPQVSFAVVTPAELGRVERLVMQQKRLKVITK